MKNDNREKEIWFADEKIKESYESLKSGKYED